MATRKRRLREMVWDAYADDQAKRRKINIDPADASTGISY